MRRRIQKKGGNLMALFTIMHIFEVPARNQYEATYQFDKVYLKKVIVKDAEAKLPREKVNVFAQKPPASMKTIFKRQITGKW
jgi:hypothetical protein